MPLRNTVPMLMKSPPVCRRPVAGCPGCLGWGRLVAGLTVLFALWAGNVLAVGGSAYERHLWDTGALLYRCSSINLIYGMNLSRPQAEQLLEMARVIEALAPPRKTNGKRESDLQNVVAAFQRLENALKIRSRVPEVFRKELMGVREQQAQTLRRGLRYDTSSLPFSCTRCHWVPGARKVGWPWIDKIAFHPGIKKEQGIAHMNAPFGLVAASVVAWYAPRIEDLLSGSQKAMVEKFSCCLLPPKDFDNPIRVGQADLADWEIPVLEKARRASKWTLPLVTAGVKHFLKRGMKALHPGTTGAQITDMNARIDEVIRKARALSEVDFELQKRELGKELSGPLASQVDPKTARLRTALFLLMPGAAEVYRQVLEQTP